MPLLYITSVPSDLEPHRSAVEDVTRRLGWQPLSRQPATGAERDLVKACAANIRSTDLVLAIVGWRLDEAPSPELGGDGRRTWLQWELLGAFELGKPVVVLMAGDSWPEASRENDPEARARVEDLRGELAKLAETFDGGPPSASDASLSNFRAQVHRLLSRHQPGSRAEPRTSPASALRRDLHLRIWPPPELPENPYPLLLPYTHPDLLAGREQELADLRLLLQLPILILGLHAASGTGKSSLLAGGLVPKLRAAGQPVACDRHPSEPGLPRRLLGDLCQLDADDGIGGLIAEDPDDFVQWLLAVEELSGKTPVLVVDQLDELLRSSGGHRPRAVLGRMLAATARRQSGRSGPPCHWLLAYRRELHGELSIWLRDVLREARAEALPGVATLPHDLSGPERFHPWALPTLGSPHPGRNANEEADRAFQAAITTPLDLRDPDGKPRYPWRFAGDGAERLARAFGRARQSQPDAPLVPELQVALAYLLDLAGLPEGSEPVLVEVPEDPEPLINQALEDHLRRALDTAFPADPSDEARRDRTHALLFLRELAGPEGQRKFLPTTRALKALGTTGPEVLDTLASPAVRLVMQEKRSQAWGFVLSHDRLAEVIPRVVESEERHGKLTADTELLELRRFVRLSSELFLTGSRQATALPRRRFRRISAHADALLWEDEHHTWWAACHEHRRARRHLLARASIAALILGLIAFGAWQLSLREKTRQLQLEQIATAEPNIALVALVGATGDPRHDLAELRDGLRQRERPLDVLEKGLSDIEETRRNATVLSLTELALPLLIDDEGQDPFLTASAVWALDAFPGRDPLLADQASSLREQILETWRFRRPPPPAPGAKDPDWIDVPGGRFLMGSLPGQGWDHKEFLNERPQHEVTLRAFRMLAHEVTNAEYRRFAPDHPGEDDLPATEVTWYEAYVYAAWLGGRLPSEAEWEYAAKTGCSFEHCNRQGDKAELKEVAWYRRNTFNLETLEPEFRPVARLEPNQLGFFDLHGNVDEWVADWYDAYPSDPQVDPWGPPSGLTRILRGGDGWDFEGRMRAVYRTGEYPGKAFDYLGFRVVLPSRAEP